MCLISVVLPAPLPPIKPKTPPRGTVSEMSSSALLLPKWRVSRWISMMGGDELGKGSLLARAEHIGKGSFMGSFLVA